MHGVYFLASVLELVSPWETDIHISALFSAERYEWSV
jgi:hypothetical protein